jgi:hypothetical protein
MLYHTYDFFYRFVLNNKLGAMKKMLLTLAIFVTLA